MNIWIVNHYAIPPSMGGLVRHYYFSKYLQKKGHTVKIFTSSKIHNTDINMIKDRSLYREEMEDGVEYTFVRSRDYKGNGLDRIVNLADLPFKMWKTMKLFYKKNRPDVIYTSSPDLFVAFFAVLFGKKHKIPVVVEVRDLWPESIVVYNHMSRHNPVIVALYALEKWLYKNAARLIFTMPGGKDYICDKHWDNKIDLSKIYNVNNGVDAKVYEYNKQNYSIEDPLLSDTDAFNIVYTGSIRKVNGIEYLIKVAEFLQKKGYDDIRFLIYGDGNDKEKLIKYCERNSIRNVYFRGKIDNRAIPYVLAQSKVNYMHGITTPIMKYGCSPNKLFDYIASGKPILSDLDTPYDIVEKYQLGKTVTSPSVKRIAKAIIEMKENYDAIAEKAKSNHVDVLKKYDYEALTNKIEKILEF